MRWVVLSVEKCYLCSVVAVSWGRTALSNWLIKKQMDETLKKKLSKDPNGLMTYEYIANNINDIDDILPELIENIKLVDKTGQFVVSTARYLHAIDSQKYAECIDVLVKAAIERDREHVYLGDLIASLWGTDYKEHAQELSEKDDNFRRIYKRLYPAEGM